MRMHKRNSGPLLLAALAVGALYLAARPDGYAADKADPAPKADASPLDFVPADAVAVVSVRVTDLWNHPAVKTVLDKQKELPEPLRGLSTYLTVRPEEIERVTLIEESAKGPQQQIIAVTMLKAYNRKAILGAVAPDAKEKDAGARSYYENPHGPSIAFLDDRTFLFAESEELHSYMRRTPAKEGPLAPALRLASGKHLVIAALDVEAVAASAPKGSEPPVWVKPLLKARVATLTVDLDSEARAEAQVIFGKEADAKDGAAGLNDALDLFRGEFVKMVKELTRDKDAPKLAGLLEDVQAALRSAKVEAKGTAVEARASLKINVESTADALTEAVVKVQKAAKRMQMSNDLKQLALSSMIYSDSNGKMLPPAIYDKNGKALLSWRVLVLPYIEQDALYRQFKLDEPWDSDNNKKLLAKMPKTFAPPESQAFKDHETFYQGFVGMGTAFEKPGLRFPTDFQDGTSQTILFVEAAKSVPWTKPDDIVFDQGKLLPKVGGLSQGGFLAALCDGSVRFFPLTIKEDNLRAWITRNGGEVNEDPDK